MVHIQIDKTIVSKRLNHIIKMWKPLKRKALKINHSKKALKLSIV